MKIKEYRIIKGYTQKELAEILGIKQNTYSDKLEKLAKEYEVELMDKW